MSDLSKLPMPLTQSEAFERTCIQLGLPVQRVVHDAGTCLIQSRKLPVIGTVHLISRGPILRQPEFVSDILAHVRDQLRGPVVINAAAGAERPGGVKLLAGAELGILDLTDEDKMRARMHQKWRNQLRKGEASPLRVIDQSLDPVRHKWFLEAEKAQQKAQRYRNYPAGFLHAYAGVNPGKARLYTAMLGREPVAAMLVLKHGFMATYQAGITTSDGRSHCAHNLLLWRIMCDLLRRKIQHLDLGRMDLSTGLRRFKAGSGARTEQLPGTYFFHHIFPRRKPRSRASTGHLPRAA